MEIIQSNIPKDIILLICSFISSFHDLRSVSCVSKTFHSIIKENDKLWMRCCIDWWNRKLDMSIYLQMHFSENEYFGDDRDILISIMEIAQSTDTSFCWKWFGMCMKNYGSFGLLWNDKKKTLEIGNFIDSKLCGIGLTINHLETIISGGIDLSVGIYENGKINGKGITIFSKGDKYEGEYLNSKYHGRGVYIWPNLVKYDGEFENSFRNGNGTIIWPNGFRIDCTWEKSIPSDIMHPTIKQKVVNGFCTGKRKRDKHAQPMFRLPCGPDGFSVCSFCWKNCIDHTPGEPFHYKLWDGYITCQCGLYNSCSSKKQKMYT